MKAGNRAGLQALAAITLATAPQLAAAVEFERWGIEGQFQSLVSLGATLRMQDADPGAIGIANGGSARSVNDDDGNLGFESGDIALAVAKATHDLELRYGDYGLMTRVSYFYDAIAAGANDRESRLGAAGMPTRDRPRGEYELGRRGRDRLRSEVDLLDLFAFGRFEIGERELHARIGRQVVSWGESSFIGNSINSINPVDVSRLRAPGAEVKEGLIPTPLLWASTQIAPGLGIEAVWMLGYEETQLDPRGSFFSTNDLISDDGNRAVVSFGRRRDDNRVSDPATPTSAMAWVPRGATRRAASPEQQFGLALRYFAEELHSTEFGLYYLKYHSRTPLISATRGAVANAGTAGNTLCESDAAAAGCLASYYSEFPSDIELWGLSFNTSGPWGVALQGEYSYRPDQPVQLAGTEVLLAAVGAPGTLGATPLPAGTHVQGFRELPVHQAQATATKAFGPMLGAQQFALVGELGVNHVELPGDGLLFNGPGASLPSCATPAQVLAAVSNGSCQQMVGGGYATKTSWGYRLVGRLDFDNLVGAATVSPRLVLSHDVNGVGPNFNKGAKAVTAGVTFSYLQQWQGDIGYTAFFGGRDYAGTDPVPPGAELNPGPPPVNAPGDSSQSARFSTSANPSRDRDFLAVSISYAF
jgi:hypothetical protein